MGYAAINLSWRDLVHGAEYLEKIRTEHDIPFISANVYLKESGVRFADPYRIKEGRHKVKFGIFGLTGESQFGATYPGGISEFELRDPLQEAKMIVEELRSRCEYIIALLYMDGAAAFELVEETGTIDIVVMGKPGYKYERPILQNGVLYLSGGRLGKFGRYADVTLSPEGGVVSFENQVQNLNEDIPDDPDFKKIVVSYNVRLTTWRKEMFERSKTPQQIK